MKRTYKDLSNKEKDIVVEVLEKYCVPKKVNVIDRAGEYYKGRYEVEIDVEDKGWNFINPKIEEALEGYRSLEKSFKLPAQEREEKKEVTRDYSNCLFEDLFKPDLGMAEIKNEHTELFKKINDLTTLAYKLINKDKEDELKNQIRKSLEDYLLPKKDIKNLIHEQLNQYFSESLLSGLVGKSLDFNKNLTDQLEGEVIKFEDLPLEVKDKLCYSYDEDILKSENCKIKKIKVPNGYGITIEFKE